MTKKIAVLTRQYYVYYKRLGSPQFAQLTPGENVGLYSRPEVKAAIEHMRTTPAVHGMSVLAENEMFNIITFTQEAIAPKAFLFTEPGVEPRAYTVGEGEEVPKTNA